MVKRGWMKKLIFRIFFSLTPGFSMDLGPLQIHWNRVENQFPQEHRAKGKLQIKAAGKRAECLKNFNKAHCNIHQLLISCDFGSWKN